MERIASSRGHVYIFGGYIYKLNSRTNNTGYYLCVTAHCGGRVVVAQEAAPVVTVNHNHAADEAEVQMLHLRNFIRHTVHEQPHLRPRGIFDLASQR